MKNKETTLEEAAENYSIYNEQINKAVQEAVKFGAQWKAERMYSEEEMIEYSDYCLMCSAEKTLKIPLLPKEWFLQFKKKL